MRLFCRWLLLLVTLAFAAPAWAQGVVLLPTGPVASDGETPVAVQFWSPALTPDTKIKAKVEGGKVTGAIQIAADGVATVQFVPPSVSGPADLPLSLRIRGPLLAADVVLQVPLVPAYGGTVGLTFDPPTWQPGTAGVMVRIQATPSPQNPDTRRFLIRATTGAVDSAIAAGGGVYATRWTPPASMGDTQIVLFTVADAAAPDQIIGWGTLPALVRRSVTFEVPPGSNSLLRVGERTWGPLPASPAGTVAFDVEVHPAIREGSLDVVGPGTARSTRVVQLSVSSGATLAFVPGPPAMPADPNVPMALYLVVLDTAGAPYAGTPPTLTANSGSLGGVTASGLPGIFTATWTPPKEPGTVTFTGSLGESRATADLRLLSPLPSVSLTAEPEVLSAKVRDFRVTATVKDSGGTALTGRPPAVSYVGALAQGKVVDNKDGTYAYQARLGTKDERVLVAADPPVEPTGLPTARVLVWADETTAVADGQAEIPVTAAAVDAYGMPVGNVVLHLSVPSGDASLPPQVTTGASGVARTFLKVGATPGPVTMRVEGAGLWSESLFFQTAPGQSAPVAAPTGTAADRKVASAWRAAAPVALVWKDTALPAVAQAPATATTQAAAVPAGQPATVTQAPASAAPTGSVWGAPAGATAAPAAATPAKVPRSAASGGSWMRLGGLVGTVAHVYDSSTRDADKVPEDAAFENGNLFGGDPFGALGVGFRGIFWPGNHAFGGDVDARAFFDRVEAADSEFTATNWAVMAGGRYRGEISSSLNWFGLAQVHRLSAMLFVFDDDAKTEVNLVQHGLWGGRVGAGLTLTLDTGRFYAEALVAETFVLFPIDTHLGLGLEYEFQDNLAAHLGAEFDFRTIAFSVYGEDVRVKDQEHAIRLGITRTFR